MRPVTFLPVCVDVSFDTSKVIIINEYHVNIIFRQIQKRANTIPMSNFLTMTCNYNELKKAYIWTKRWNPHRISRHKTQLRTSHRRIILNSNTPTAAGRHCRRSERGAAVARESPQQSCPYTTTDERARQWRWPCPAVLYL